MAVEDDYDMIDGIINNCPKEPTVAELEPVSYTHLDVYKRQLPCQGRLAGGDQCHKAVFRAVSPHPQHLSLIHI